MSYSIVSTRPFKIFDHTSGCIYIGMVTHIHSDHFVFEQKDGTIRKFDLSVLLAAAGKAKKQENGVC